MDTPIFKNLKGLCDAFHTYANKQTGIAKGEEVDKFVAENLSGWLKCPSDKDTADKLKAKVEALKGKGIDKNGYVELICLLLHAYSEGRIGVKGCEPSASS